MLNIFLGLPVLFFSAIFHECAHGWAALKCGDDTAYRMGRITLNPLPHIDLFGTIILPVILTLLRSNVLFAYAKPVPINPYKFYDYKKGLLLVSCAGPLSNFLLAVIAATILWLIRYFYPYLIFSFVWILLMHFVTINVFLGVLNLIPIPPIDGSKILLSVLPVEISIKIEKYSNYGFFLILFLFTTGFFQIIIGRVSNFIINILLKGIA